MSERVAIGILVSVMTCFLILVIALVAFGVREFIWMCRETHEKHTGCEALAKCRKRRRRR